MTKTSIFYLFLYISFFTVSAQNISKLDPNFAAAKVAESNSMQWRNALEEKEVFTLEGFPWRIGNEPLYRIPSKYADDHNISGGVRALAAHTSGGVVRFATDSKKIAVRMKIGHGSDMNHMPRTGSAGLDFYAAPLGRKPTYLKTVQPSAEEVRGKILTQNVSEFPKAEMRIVEIYLPLYSGVDSLEIGLDASAKFGTVPERKISKPVVFYGSSITQGACASRPANAYNAMLARELDAPLVNLGFSGNAKGEKIMAEIVASLDMAAFVYDYDYNAPSVEHLIKTHSEFFKIVRRAHPKTPIIILSRCSQYTNARRDVVRQTYLDAVSAGDTAVYFIDGSSLFGEAGLDYCTVDNCHPNDLGFYNMYKTVLPVLANALKKVE